MTRPDHELAALRATAAEMAKAKNESLSTGHLLAAIATTPTPAADLLAERRLDEATLGRAARVAVDDQKDGIGRALDRARDLASRLRPARGPSEKPEAPRSGPTAVHLLLALCHDPQCGAHRALVQCGVDVGKLRAAAMQIAMGLVPPRRAPAQQKLGAPRVAPASVSMPAAPVRPTSPQARPAVRPPSAPPSSTRRPLLGTGTADAKPPAPSKASPARGPARGPSPEQKRPRRGNERPKRSELCAKTFPALSALTKNLTLAAEAGELDPVVGRDLEIERTLDVLAKRSSNCPVLVGAAGVGKTSVVRGIAQRIISGQDVACFEDRVVLEVEPSQLLAGAGVRGALAEKLEQLFQEASRAEGRVILFFDEIHTLLGPDAGDEAQSAFKLWLSRGTVPCVGATTLDEHKRTIERDPALSRRFTVVDVPELSPEEAVLAIERTLPLFESHHGLTFDKLAIARAVRWSVQYVHEHALPDKAVQLLDLAGARTRRKGEAHVDLERLAAVTSELSGVPVERLLESDGARMLALEGDLASRIVGHGDALARIAAVLRRNASGFRAARPIGTFLLLGPTGVGKTETAKAIAECLFDSESAMTRLDLSEYAEPHSIARLVGAPPGYVGHEAGGQLTEAVRRRPYQVVLLDEIEKAHRDVLEGFLQVFDEGRLTDGRGRTIDFTHTVILLTSNLGAEQATSARASRTPIGFAARRDSEEARAHAAAADAVVAAARAALPPELYNRLDEVIAFSPLTRHDVAEVARRMLARMAVELEATRGVRLDVHESVIDALLDSGGFDPELGARPMRRAIGRHVETQIAEAILRGEVRRGDTILVEAEGGEIRLDRVDGSEHAAE